jgi:SAM-dependent methyltransferase
MIAEARRRAALEGVGARCRFRVGDLATLELAEQFDLVLGVTVLQHVLDPGSLHAALQAMVRHLAPTGRMLLLEAAPRARVGRCDSSVFTARTRAVYCDLLADCGLKLRTLSGVDPAPFRTLLLPHLSRMPGLLRTAALGVATGLSLPINGLLGRRWLERSWHVVFVLEHADREA